MATTVPDGIWSPDDSTAYNPPVDLAAMADTIQVALDNVREQEDRRIGLDSSRLTLAPPLKRAGVKWFSTDTGREWLSIDATAGAGGWIVSSFSGVSLRTSLPQVTDASTFTPKPILWNIEDFDTDNYHLAGSSSRLTAPSAGYYRVTAKMRTASTTVPSGLSLAVNGVNDNVTRVVSQPSLAASAFSLTTRIFSLAAGGYVEVMSQGGTPNMDIVPGECFAEMVKLS